MGRLLALVAGCVVLCALFIGVTNLIMVSSTKSDIAEDPDQALALMVRWSQDAGMDASSSSGGPDLSSGAAGQDPNVAGQSSVVDESSAADDADGTGRADAIVVLGASVLPDGRPSGILQDRLDCGVRLYEAGVAPKIIVSGDNGQATYNEVEAMKRYAVAQGVPSEDVFCDHAGFSTYESMYRAKYVFGCERIVVATQTYHLYRALYAAQGLGMQAVGVQSDFHTYGGQLWFSTREALARAKDFVKLIYQPESTFVGDPISLDQSGDVTNG